MIIYNNKEEVYDISRSTSFAEISKEQGDKYTKDDAIRLCEDMREVHFTRDIKAHGIKCKCKEIDKELDMGIKGCKCKIVDDKERSLQELDVDFVELV